MQYVNDDMDDLFRRAAADYPLNTDSADWNEVSRKMAAIADVRPEKNNKKHLLWLLLLIPAAIMYYYLERPADGNKPGVEISSNSISNINSKKDVARNNTVTIPTAPLPANILKVQPSENRSQLIDPSANASIFQKNHKPEQTSVSYVQSKVNVNNGSKERKGEADNKSSDDIFINKNKNVVTDQSNIITTNANDKPAVIKQPDILNNNGSNNIPVINSDTEKQVNADQKETAADQQDVKKFRSKIRKPHGFYAGVLVSPDLSTVKMQSVKKVGSTIGVIAGYRFNKRISVESGAFWNVKNYYSKGEYFSTSRIHLSANAKINSVVGSCKMIEVPVNIKYDLGTTKHFSLSAGVSSYIMKKEKYTYDITRNSSRYPYTATYKNSSNHYAAMANLSAGYEKDIRIVTLRIQPYIKIPLHGMGIGNLPLTSTGINIGITKMLTH